jgi:hypothetical protein
VQRKYILIFWHLSPTPEQFVIHIELEKIIPDMPETAAAWHDKTAGQRAH